MVFKYIEYGNLTSIKVGQSRDELVRILGSTNILQFKKNENDPNLSDYFEDYGMFIYYDKNFVSQAFEFDENGEVFFDGKNIINRTIGDLLNDLDNKDDNLVKDFSGFTSFKFGISGYTGESIEEHDIPFEAIMFFKQGYYG